MPVDGDTSKHLDAAKKGKPRRFVMVCKGVKILSLVVFQKGSVASKVKEAKEKGSGNVFSGVITGRAPDLRFQLLASDYAAPPGRELILKDFLATEADLKCKPVYELVGSLSDVPEDDQEGGGATAAPAPPVQPTASPAPPVAETSGSSAPDAAKLTEALKRLMGLAEKALAAHPGRRDEIMGPLVAIRQQMKDGLLEEARAGLQKHAAFLLPLTGPGGDAAGGGVLLAKLGKARLEWPSVRDRAIQDVRTLLKAIDDEFKGEADQTSQLSAAKKRLDELIAKIDSDLHEQLDAVLNAAPPARGPLIQAARNTIQEFVAFLNTDPVMQEIDDNEVIPGMAVQAPLKTKLLEIEAAMPGV